MEVNTTNTRYSREWEQIHSAFLVLVIFTALLGNGFVCAAVYRVRRLQKVSNYFLVSLAASDILVVLFAIPFRIYFELNSPSGWLLGKHACQFWIFVDLLCCSASIVNLSLVSVDRYVALSRPLRYVVIMTLRRCKISITSVWFFSFTISLLSVHTWSEDGSLRHNPACLKHDKIYYTLATVLAILIPLSVLVVLYCLVFKMALKQGKKIYGSALRNSLRPLRSQSGDSDSLQTGHDSTRRRFAVRELKAAKTLIIVVGTFLLCWLPLFVILFLQQYSPTYIEKLSPKTQQILGQLFLFTLPPLNSALNPFIYTFFNVEFRKVFKDTLQKCLPFLKSKSSSENYRRRHPSQVEISEA